MGPNLYITPPGSFTHFHQDGYGTVDSGHLCLSGYNEIVMLRRLPTNHKENAMNILTGQYSEGSPIYDGLYKLPHGSDNVSQQIADCYRSLCSNAHRLLILTHSTRNQSGLVPTPFKSAANGGKFIFIQM